MGLDWGTRSSISDGIAAAPGTPVTAVPWENGLFALEVMKELPPAKPPFGRLRIENPDHFAAVYVNGRFMGHVDEFSNFAQGLLLNLGTYEVKVVPVNGSGEVMRTVTLAADQTVIVK